MSDEKSTTKVGKARGGRKRRGSLYWTKSGWRARLTVDVDGVPVQKSFDLETTDRSAAKVKLRRLVKKQAPVAELEAEAALLETVSEAIERIVPGQGIATWKERLSALRRLVVPKIGAKRIDAIRPGDIREVLEAAVEGGLAKQSIVHLRNHLSTVFGELWRDELIDENPVKRVKLPKGLRKDKRPRVSPTDVEFARFMACAAVPEHVHLMALTSRAFGGMRTSDLHAWDWAHVDTETFLSAKVYRPKTDDHEDAPAVLEELIIPEVLREPLIAWWTRWREAFAPGQPDDGTRGPTSGPVFPRMNGKQAGERQGKRSHARDLRNGFWAAGVHRALPGFEAALAAFHEADARVEPAKKQGRRAWWQARRDRRRALEAVQALDLIQTDGEATRRLDFHSLRRSYNTALARTGVNVQQAMALAGHKNAQTHMRYVQLAQFGPLEQPAGAMPVVLWPGNDPVSASSMQEPEPPSATGTHDAASFLRRPHRDSNPGYRRERRSEEHADSIKHAGSLSGAEHADSEKMRGTGAPCSFSMQELKTPSVPGVRAAADAGLRAYLRVLADGIAGQLPPEARA